MTNERSVIENILLSDLSSSWSEHLSSRLFEAVELGMLSSLMGFSLSAATVVLPKMPSDIRATIQPDMSANWIFRKPHPAGEWVRRTDFLSAASDIVSTFDGGLPRYLICEAGYAKVGDKSLSRFGSFSQEGQAFIYVKITREDPNGIEDLLKAARGFRLLGLVLEINCEPVDMKGRKIAFLCDALDGDSIIICPGEKNSIC